MFNTMTRKHFLKGSLGVAATAVLAGCAPSGTSTGGGQAAAKILRFGVRNPKTSFDQQTNTSSVGVTEAVCESLVELNPDTQEIDPILVTKLPEVSEDGLVWSFELKKGVKFHDGTELKASDVKFTFTRIFLPETKSTAIDGFRYLKGAEEVLAGQTTELSGIQIQDDYHFTMELTKPLAAWLYLIGQFYGVIYPEKACTEAGSDWGTDLNFIGTGPYKLVSNDGTTETKLEGFADYHQGKPGLDELVFTYIDDANTRMLNYKKGDIDLAFLDLSLLPQYNNDDDVKNDIEYYEPASCQFLNLNQKKNPALADVRVREALSLALDRETLCSTILSGAAKPASGFIPPSEKGYNDKNDVLAYDPEKAKQLLAEAGYADLTLTAQVRATDQTLMVAIQDAWAQIGVTCDVQIMDAGVWADARTNGDLEVTLVTWSTLSFVAAEHVGSYFTSDRAALKSNFYNNPEFDTLIEKARTTLDQDKVVDYMMEADTLLSRKDYGCVAVDWPQMPYVLRPQYSGLQVLVNPHFRNVKVS